MIRATGTRVIVARVELEQATTGGIILQGGPKEIPQGRIVATGPRITAEVAVGDLVHLDWRGSAEITWQDQKYYVVDQSNLLAVVLD
jgi:co-chaperonin GroES (HSP10)